MSFPAFGLTAKGGQSLPPLDLGYGNYSKAKEAIDLTLPNVLSTGKSGQLVQPITSNLGAKAAQALNMYPDYSPPSVASVPGSFKGPQFLPQFFPDQGTNGSEALDLFKGLAGSILSQTSGNGVPETTSEFIPVGYEGGSDFLTPANIAIGVVVIGALVYALNRK